MPRDRQGRMMRLPLVSGVAVSTRGDDDVEKVVPLYEVAVVWTRTVVSVVNGLVKIVVYFGKLLGVMGCIFRTWQLVLSAWRVVRIPWKRTRRSTDTLRN